MPLKSAAYVPLDGTGAGRERQHVPLAVAVGHVTTSQCDGDTGADQHKTAYRTSVQYAVVLNTKLLVQGSSMQSRSCSGCPATHRA